MTYELEEMIQYLSLSNLIEMRYEIEKDHFELFRILPDEKQILYEGTLSKWRERVETEQKGEDSEMLEALCLDLLSGRESFQYEINIGTECFYVNCKTVCSLSGGRIVYGSVRQGGGCDLLSEFSFRRATDRDPMLDMLNKKAIITYAQDRLQHPELTTYLVMLDLDNFKMVNDTFGHMFGDEVLVTFTEIINKAIGKHGLVGRMGGDEVLIVTKDIPDKPALRTYLREIRTNLELTYKGKLNGISLTCSIGAAAYPIHAGTYRETLELADKMLYLAKEKGRNRYLIYTPELHEDYVKNNQGENCEPLVQSKQYDAVGVMQYMLTDYLTLQISSNDYAFEQVGKAFRLNEVLCVYNQGDIGYLWTSEGEKLQEKDMHLLEIFDPFFDEMNANDLFIMDGLYDVQDRFPKLYEKLTARKIESAIFYRLKKNGVPDGYMIFAKRHQRQKWSEYEVMSLATIAKIFELSIGADR
ncbi:MAG: GGDEF domain-containing protein [Acetatifactor sp.]